MRHTTNENVTVLAKFDTGETVSIALFDLSSDSGVVLSNSGCTERGSSGTFKWNTSDIATPPTGFKEYEWEMSDSQGITRTGKIVLNGWTSRVEENAFGGCVWVDSNSSNSGTTYPCGTELNPVNNFTDALAIGSSNSINRFRVSGSITVGASEDISNMTFDEWGEHATITLSDGCTTENTSFFGHIHIQGYFNGHVHCNGVHLYENTYNLAGFFDECLFDDGNYSFNGSSLTRLINCISSGQQGQAVVFSTPGSGVDLGIWGWSGKMELEDKDGSETFDIEMLTGEIEIASSCTGGQVRVRGIAEVTDNSGGGCSVNTGKLITKQIDDQLSSVHGAGSWLTADVSALALEATVSGVSAQIVIVQSDLDNPDQYKADVTTLENSLNRLLGLSHENCYIDQTVYDSYGNLQTARMRTYSASGSVGTDSDVLATYQITSVGTAQNRFSSWKQVRSE